MAEIRVRPRPEADADFVNDNNPFPVRDVGMPIPPLFAGVPVSADYLWHLAAKGRLFISSDADQNDVVTGQTSFANTTPTFLLDVPEGTVAVPLFLNLSQTGTVAGGAIDVIIEIDNKTRWASGGTSEKVFSPNTANHLTNKCTLYTGATAGAGYGMNLVRATIGQDVSPAEGAIPGPFWKPELPYALYGPASWLIYTYAGTTGPTWFWALAWAEIATKDI